MNKLPIRGNAGMLTAARLTQATAARLNLVAVAPTLETLAGRQAATGRFMPGATRTMLEMVEDELRTYLEGMAERFLAEGVAVSARCRNHPRQGRHESLLGP